MAETLAAMEACIAETMEETEWTREEALVRISDCRRRTGISYDDYRKMRMYKVAPENQASHYERILKKRAQDRKDRRECLEVTMAATGWLEKEALEKIQACRDALGISYRDYMDLEMFNATPEEQESRYQLLKEKREREKRDRRRCITAVMTDLGCARDLAIDMIENCRERLGVSYRDYRKLELWKLERHEQRQRYREYRQERRDQRADRASCAAAAAAAMGWTEEEALEAIRAARKDLGIPYRAYEELELWGKSPEEQAALYEAYKEQLPADEDVAAEE